MSAGFYQLTEQSSWFSKEYFGFVKFGRSTVVHYKNVVTVHDGIQTMCHSDASSILKLVPHDGLDASVRV